MLDEKEEGLVRPHLLQLVGHKTRAKPARQDNRNLVRIGGLKGGSLFWVKEWGKRRAALRRKMRLSMQPQMNWATPTGIFQAVTQHLHK